MKLLDERERFQKEISERARKEVEEEITRLRAAESERIATAPNAKLPPKIWPLILPKN